MDDDARHSLSLRDAVAELKRHHRGGNAYDWYRRDAQRGGRIWLGTGCQLEPGGERPVMVSARKIGGRWMVDAEGFRSALHELDRAQGELAMITAAYEDQQLLGGVGKSLRTSWGGYRVADRFHFVWNSMSIYRHDSYGIWRCNTCWKPAETQHDRAECHICSDWGTCGRDCTLSGIACGTCLTSMAL
jgi:hypothetical protein